MKRFLAIIALSLLAGTASAQFISSGGTSSGSGTPGGSPNQIQYNNAGSFGGDPSLTYNGTITTQASPYQFSIGSDATGDIWFRSAAGTLNRLALGVSGQVLQVTAATGLPQWNTFITTATPCTTTANAVQYNNAGALGCISNALSNGTTLSVSSSDLIVGTTTLVGNGGTATFPNNTGTIAEVNFAQTWAAAQNFNSGNLVMAGLSSGATTLLPSAAAGTTVAGFPSNSGTVAELNLAQTWTANQTFQGTTTAQTLAVTSNTSTSSLNIANIIGTQCLQATGTGTVSGTGAACSSGGTPGGNPGNVQYNNAGAFGGISNVQSNGTTLSVSSSDFIIGTTTLIGSGGTATFPNNTGTIGELNLAQTWTATQTYTDGSFALNGLVSGVTTLKAAAAAGTTIAQFPTNSGTVAELNLAQTWTGNQTFNGTTTAQTLAITSSASTPSLNVTGTATAQVLAATTSASVNTFTISSIIGTQCLNVTGTGAVSGTGSACSSGGTPGGNFNNLEYNNAGAFGGIASAQSNGITISVSNSALIVGSTTLIGNGGTATFPNNTGTLAETNLAQNWTAGQVYTNNSLAIQGLNTGVVTLQNSNLTATNFTASIPANTGTVAELNLAQTWSAGQTFSGTTTASTLAVTSNTSTSSLNIANVIGTQCLHATGTGTVSGTGSDCSAGGTPSKGGPLLPSSIYLGNASGELFPTFYISQNPTNFNGALEGTGAIGTLTPTAYAIYQFNMPETIPTGSLKLRLVAVANASSGIAAILVSDQAVSVGSQLATPASAVFSESATNFNFTTPNVLTEQKIALTATPTANQFLTVILGFNATPWTLTAQSVWQASIVWE